MFPCGNVNMVSSIKREKSTQYKLSKNYVSKNHFHEWPSYLLGRKISIPTCKLFLTYRKNVSLKGEWTVSDSLPTHPPTHPHLEDGF